MKQCPFCDKDSRPMEQATAVSVLQTLGLDMNSGLGGMVLRSLNPTGRVFRCPKCGFIAIFS